MRAMLALVMSALLVSMSPADAEPVRLYAAGSLRAALTDVAKAYEAESHDGVEAKFGRSGVLETEIIGGAKADVFASADMRHPQALSAAGKSGPVLLFARNRMCALVRPGLAVDSATLLDRMLDPEVKLATSTPKSDPSGDYALEVFRKAAELRPAANVILEKKALRLTGAPDSATPPPGFSASAWHIAEGRADIFLTYCTAAQAAVMQDPAQQIVQLPDRLAVSADYGLTVMAGAAPAAHALAQFIISPAGQTMLAAHGFAPAHD